MSYPREYTYDDVLLVPRYSEILPEEANLTAQFSQNIPLNIPLVSAAMDTVTEAATAIVMAQQGGIGVIHKNLSCGSQAKEVEKVKKHVSGVVWAPVTVGPGTSLREVAKVKEKHAITGVLVVDEDDRLVGIFTSRDQCFESCDHRPVREVMTPRERLITAPEGTDLSTAKQLLHKHRIEKLPIVGPGGQLKGLVTIRDIRKSIDFPLSNKDSLGRLRVAAAVGVGEEEFSQRAQALVEARVDALVVDTAHGHCRRVLEMVKRLRAAFPQVDVVAGNVATKEACTDLIEAGAQGVKVGIGPGSICTTRIVAGVGVPQLSAIVHCAQVCRSHNIPLIADGGIQYSGDVVKALAAGSFCVMGGSLFAGTDEAPGERILYQGRFYKSYRGMGSLGAMALGSKDRYGQPRQNDSSKLVPEGIEGQVPYRGSLASNLYQIVGGLRAGMGYLGAHNLSELWEKAQFCAISSASLKEGHPHGVMVTKEAPNYHRA